MEELERQRLSVFPSPATHTIQIQGDLPEAAQGILSIYDAMGKQQYQKTMELPLRLDVSFLQKGLYFIRFSTERGIFSGKFIKM